MDEWCVCVCGGMSLIPRKEGSPLMDSMDEPGRCHAKLNVTSKHCRPSVYIHSKLKSETQGHMTGLRGRNWVVGGVQGWGGGTDFQFCRVSKLWRPGILHGMMATVLIVCLKFAENNPKYSHQSSCPCFLQFSTFFWEELGNSQPHKKLNKAQASFWVCISCK